jgi:hypothetical protein
MYSRLGSQGFWSLILLAQTMEAELGRDGETLARRGAAHALTRSYLQIQAYFSYGVATIHARTFSELH